MRPGNYGVASTATECSSDAKQQGRRIREGESSTNIAAAGKGKTEIVQ